MSLEFGNPAPLGMQVGGSHLAQTSSGYLTLRCRETYEIMRPESIGLVRDCDAGLVLGKHSGR